MSEDVSKNVAHAKPLRSSCVYKQSWMIEPSLAEGGTDVKGEVVLAVSQPRERSIIGALYTDRGNRPGSNPNGPYRPRSALPVPVPCPYWPSDHSLRARS